MIVVVARCLPIARHNCAAITGYDDCERSPRRIEKGGWLECIQPSDREKVIRGALILLTSYYPVSSIVRVFFFFLRLPRASLYRVDVARLDSLGLDYGSIANFFFASMFRASFNPAGWIARCTESTTRRTTMKKLSALSNCRSTVKENRATICFVSESNASIFTVPGLFLTRCFAHHAGGKWEIVKIRTSNRNVEEFFSWKLQLFSL